jgi:hypothetical protein
VAGVNVGAQSYWDALATMGMHTRGVLIMTPGASMVLTGSGRAASGEDPETALLAGEFEEWDLDPESGRARSVAGRPYGRNSCSVVFGVITTSTRKYPEGMKRVLVLSDPTQGMGSLAAAECDRIVAALDLAEELRVPVEWLPVSSGARIAMDSGTENLDATARVVRRIIEFTQADGVIHAIVAGVNVGAQSYWDALATMGMHTRGVLIMTPGASMVLTGRPPVPSPPRTSRRSAVSSASWDRTARPSTTPPISRMRIASSTSTTTTATSCPERPGRGRGPARIRWIAALDRTRATR